MFRKAILVVLETLLLFAAFGLGSFLPVFGVLPMWRVAVSPVHWLVVDGLVLMLAVFLIILGIAAALRRLRSAAALSALSLALAMALGFAMKFGLVERVAGGR